MARYHAMRSAKQSTTHISRDDGTIRISDEVSNRVFSSFDMAQGHAQDDICI